MHIGSQLSLARALPARDRARWPRSATSASYDLGGGLGGPVHRATSAAARVEDWVDGMVAAARAELGAGRELVLEPGRALVANAA